MTILVVNVGSGSQKVSLFKMGKRLPKEPLSPLWTGKIESTGLGLKKGEYRRTVKRDGKEQKRILRGLKSRGELLTNLIKMLWEEKSPVLSGPKDIDLIGHRVVHGGMEFAEAAWVTNKVKRSIRKLAQFAPLHNPVNLEGIEICQRLFGRKIRQVAVFDTSFHRTLSLAAATYPGPYEWVEKGIRRYGFHGTSFRWLNRRAAELLGRPDDSHLRLILCHLGGGCSLAATIGGKSVDTTMGFTPLDGIAMCTRSGSLDPGILLYLLRENPDLDKLERTLNKQSGLKGLSGLAGDTRVVLKQVRKGDKKAILALSVFMHRLRAGIGQMMASLGKAPDGIVFADAIGESEQLIRAKACEPFRFLGIKLDVRRNRSGRIDSLISTRSSRVAVLLLKSREDWQIALDCFTLGVKRRAKK